jgi:hypothetical protein
LTGLDEHHVRRWTSWHRWTILAMLAHAFLAVTVATARADTTAPPELIALTANEMRHLFTAWSTTPAANSHTCCTGHGGDAATKPEPANATTAVKQSVGGARKLNSSRVKVSTRRLECDHFGGLDADQ